MASATAPMRKTVTVLFCDLVDSTALAERIDPERLRELLTRWYEAMRTPVERHGGTVEKFIGDAVMAVFGVPHAHEDDALRAVRAAFDMRNAVAALNEELAGPRHRPLEIRIGVNTGEVVTGGETATLVSGDAVNTAKRLEQAAPAGEILVGAATRRLVENAVELEPVAAVMARGKRAPVQAWRALGAIPGASVFARRLDGPLVGRRLELQTLREQLAAAARDRACRVVTVVGPAGIGKSRLAAEFLFDAPATLTTRCLPYGDEISLLPLADLVRSAGGLDAVARAVAGEPDGALIGDRITGGTASAEELQWSVRRLLETLARDVPLVVCVEDAHWAQPAFLDLLEYVAGWTRNAPVLLLCLARPELLEVRPHWPGTALALEPLDESESHELIGALAEGVAAETRRDVADAAEGNPLFLEQIVAMLADGGSLRDVPPTIQALLAARLDALDDDERSVLERAAVIGRDFSRGAIAELVDGDCAPVLLALARKDLLRPAQSPYAGDDGFRFRHALIRDAAYAAIPKRLRAELHERVASWLAVRGAHDELVGYHLEQAHECLAALGRRDDGVAERAGSLLGRAGIRAAGRGDVAAALSLLRRSLGLLPGAHPLRVELLRELSGALWSAGELDAADLALTEAISLARASGDTRSEWYSRLERAARNVPTSGDAELLRTTAERAIEVFDELGDDLGLARAWRRIALLAHAASRWADCAAAAERAVRYATASGSEQEHARSADLLCTALLYGPARVDEAIVRIERLRADASANLVLGANAASALAPLHAMRGEFDRARAIAVEAGTTYEELGLRMPWVGWTEVSAEVELLAGEPAAAVATLEQGYAVLDAGGHRALAAHHAALLAYALVAAGDTRRAREHALAASHADVVLAPGARARLCATQALLVADADDARRLALEAVSAAATTDDLNLQGDARLTLGRVADDPAETATAVRLYELKGNLAAAAAAGAWSPQP